MFCLCGSMVYMFGVAPAPLNMGFAMAQHNTSISPYSPNGKGCHLLHASTTTFLFVSRVLWLMLRHGLDAFARSLRWCTHLPHPGLHDLGTSAADMAQHLVQPTSPSHKSHIQVLVTSGGLGMVTGLNTRHLLQLPLKLTNSARHLHCRAATLH
jgi:hypothetical protein